MTAPLVVFHDVSVCDRCGGEATIWTDGTRCIILTLGLEAGSYEREGTQITALCGALYADQICSKVLTFDLATEAWTTSRGAIEFLMELGEELPA